jgi:putative PIN family toxin of toxin-antitoxin system
MLSEESTPGAILSLVLEGEIQLCIDDRVLAEYDRVLRRPKFPFTPAKIESLLAYIKLTAISVNATVWPYELPDPDDRPFIEVASASGADYLVTGNARHYPADRCGEVRVVSPAEFLNRYKGLR